MRKLLLLLLLIPNIAIAQECHYTDTTYYRERKLAPLDTLGSANTQLYRLKSDIREAGTEFLVYDRAAKAGRALQFIGVIVVVFGACRTDVFNSAQTGIQQQIGQTYAFVLLGGVCYAIGALIEVASHKHLKHAGIIMEGNSVYLPLINPLWYQKKGRKRPTYGDD